MGLLVHCLGLTVHGRERSGIPGLDLCYSCGAAFPAQPGGPLRSCLDGEAEHSQQVGLARTEARSLSRKACKC